MSTLADAKKTRGLGRGLNALFEDEEPVYDAPADSSAGRTGRDRLGVELLGPSPLQPRRHFDAEAIEQLAESIKAHGMIQPIVVRAIKEKPGRYEIIAGERRWRAAQKAQLHEVPVVILDLDDEAALEIALIENLQRQDLNPVEEARGYQKLLDDYGHTQEKLAEALGKSRPHIANMVRLLKLPEKVLGHLEAGKLSMGHARALIGASNAEKLAQEIIAQDLSVRQTEALAAQDMGRPAAPSAAKAKSAKDTDTLALEKEISDRLGMSVSIDSRGGQKGTLKVSYNSLDQLDELLALLSGTSGSSSHRSRLLS
jgi:ParB family chromosome partitioning protein